MIITYLFSRIVNLSSLLRWLSYLQYYFFVINRLQTLYLCKQHAHERELGANFYDVYFNHHMRRLRFHAHDIPIILLAVAYLLKSLIAISSLYQWHPVCSLVLIFLMRYVYLQYGSSTFSTLLLPCIASTKISPLQHNGKNFVCIAYIGILK